MTGMSKNKVPLKIAFEWWGGGAASVMGMKDRAVGRQMASGLLLREIKQKYMLRTPE